MENILLSPAKSLQMAVLRLLIILAAHRAFPPRALQAEGLRRPRGLPCHSLAPSSQPGGILLASSIVIIDY